MLFFKFVFSIIIVIRISDLIYSYNPISSTNFKIRKADIYFAKTNFKSDFFNSYLRIEKNSHKRIFMSNRGTTRAMLPILRGYPANVTRVSCSYDEGILQLRRGFQKVYSVLTFAELPLEMIYHIFEIARAAGRPHGPFKTSRNTANLNFIFSALELLLCLDDRHGRPRKMLCSS